MYSVSTACSVYDMKIPAAMAHIAVSFLSAADAGFLSPRCAHCSWLGATPTKRILKREGLRLDSLE